MHYSQFQLLNYKGFLDSGPITLKPGFNILTGQNDAGKTALLEALSLIFQNKPHRSGASAPTRESIVQQHSQVFCHFVVPLQELQSVTARFTDLWVPIQQDAGLPTTAVRLAELFKKPELHVDAYFIGGQLSRIHIPPLTTTPVPAHQSATSFSRNADGTYKASGSTTSGLQNNDIRKLLEVHFHQRIYAFRAERFKIGRSAFGIDSALHSDASNLPEVLNTLQANPARFRRFTELVRRVFPHIQHITLPPITNAEVEIRLWADDPVQERDDLTIPLSESGTGVAQVMAMLYVLVTADFPRILIIDEPNSFLHPGAVRSLIEIFREYDQHQYIVTTHSPEFITSAAPSTIHILRRKGASTVEQVDAKEAKHLKSILSEVGSRLSDVFGADSILWVEGPTEELCFPLIIRKLLKRPLGRTAIVGVVNTGDFDRADARFVMRIYERLSQGPALLPPAIGFIFDRELRTEKVRADVEHQSKKRITFLPRRTYENYLLHPAAISYVLNSVLLPQDRQLTEFDVSGWIEQHRDEYFGKAKGRDFLLDVDAPKLLSALFFELSGQTLEYSKTEHSPMLTEWLLEHAPQSLQELANLIDEKLKQSTSIKEAMDAKPET